MVVAITQRNFTSAFVVEVGRKEILPVDVDSNERVKIELFGYRGWPVSALLLDDPLKIVGEEEGLMLPAPDVAAVLGAKGSIDGEKWTLVEPSDTALSKTAFARSQSACFAQGGCFVDPSRDLCMIPCPTPTHPAPPAVVEYVMIDCSNGCGSGSPADATCPAGSLRLPGSGGACIEAETCSDGEWPDAVPPPALYVRAGAPAGGNGSRTSPFGTIEEALMAASPETTIVLGAGIHLHTSPLTLRSVMLRGNCTSNTWLRGGLLVLDGSEVRHVRIEENVSIHGVVQSRLEHVRFSGSSIVIGAEAKAHLNLVYGERSTLLLERSAEVELSNSMLLGPAARIDSREQSILSIRTATLDLGWTIQIRGGRLDLRDVSISPRDERFPPGITIVDGEMTAERLFASRTHTTLEDSVASVRESEIGEIGATASELNLLDVQVNGIVHVLRGHLTSTRISAQSIETDSASATIRDARLGKAGLRAENTEDEVTIDVERLEAGSLTAFGSVRVNGRDIILNRRGSTECLFCGNLCARGSAKMELDRVDMTALRGPAITAAGANTELRARDVAAREIRRGTCVFDGQALAVNDGASAHVERFHFWAMDSQAVAIGDGQIKAIDGLIQDVPVGVVLLEGQRTVHQELVNVRFEDVGIPIKN